MSLETPPTGQRQGFGSLEDLVTFLRQQMDALCEEDNDLNAVTECRQRHHQYSTKCRRLLQLQEENTMNAAHRSLGTLDSVHGPCVCPRICGGRRRCYGSERMRSRLCYAARSAHSPCCPQALMTPRTCSAPSMLPWRPVRARRCRLSARGLSHGADRRERIPRQLLRRWRRQDGGVQPAASVRHPGRYVPQPALGREPVADPFCLCRR